VRLILGIDLGDDVDVAPLGVTMPTPITSKSIAGRTVSATRSKTSFTLSVEPGTTGSRSSAVMRSRRRRSRGRSTALSTAGAMWSAT